MLKIKKRGTVYHAIGTLGGKRVRTSLNTASYKIAKIALEDLQNDILRGDKSDSSNKYFKDAVESYLKRNPDVSNTTVHYLAKFTKICTVPLSDVSTQGIEDWIDDRLDEGVSGATVRREMNAFMPVLRHAHKRGWIKDVPSVSRPADGEPRLRYLSEQEYETMFLQEQCKSKGGAHNYAWHLAHILVNTGGRIGELVQLTWDDVVMGTNDPYIRLTTRKRKGSKKSTRQIPLNSIVLKSFDCMLSSFSTKPPKTAKIFPMWLDQRAAGKQVQRVATSVGIDDFRPHDLRRTFATRLLNSGVNPRTVADLLGHTDLTMVMRYMVPPDELKRSAVDSLVMAQRSLMQ